MLNASVRSTDEVLAERMHAISLAEVCVARPSAHVVVEVVHVVARFPSHIERRQRCPFGIVLILVKNVVEFDGVL